MPSQLDVGNDAAPEVHPRAADASTEALNRVLGAIVLTGVVPDVDIFDDEHGEEGSTISAPRARN